MVLNQNAIYRKLKIRQIIKNFKRSDRTKDGPVCYVGFTIIYSTDLEFWNLGI